MVSGSTSRPLTASSRSPAVIPTSALAAGESGRTSVTSRPGPPAAGSKTAPIQPVWSPPVGRAAAVRVVTHVRGVELAEHEVDDIGEVGVAGRLDGPRPVGVVDGVPVRAVEIGIVEVLVEGGPGFVEDDAALDPPVDLVTWR